MIKAVIGIVVLLPLVSSCVAVAAAGVVGVGVVQYQRNEVEKDFGTGLRETWDATLEALERLDIVPTTSVCDATEGRIEHDDMNLVVERHAEGYTRVRVRVGTFHSRDHVRRAELVLQEISVSIEGRDELRAWAEKTDSSEPTAEAAPNPK